MFDLKRRQIATVMVFALIAAVAIPAMAAGRFVCWKDKNGKVVGCGDAIPPEYRDNAANEIDRRGLTRGTLESAEEAARRRAQEQANARQKEERQRRLADQQRQDTALLATYANVREIDQRRNRELQQVDLAITQLQAPLKNATDRYNDAKKRDAKDDMTRAAAEKGTFEQQIAEKEKEKAAIMERYAAQKKRYTELKGAPVPISAGTK